MVKWWPREVVRDDNMATESTTDGALNRWYRSRIGTATTDDEVRGYWLFALGVVLGVAGILLFVPSESAGALRQWAVVAAATGLVCVFAGPIIRLPTETRGRHCSSTRAPPSVWSQSPGSSWRTLRLEPADRPADHRRPLLAGTAGDGARRRVRPAADDRRCGRGRTRGAAVEAEDLRHSVSDTEADESDLAAQLRALRQSQARFELYEDKGGQYRWRLRHRNGNVIADGGEGVHPEAQRPEGDAERATERPRRDRATRRKRDRPSRGRGVLRAGRGNPSQASFELYEDNAGEFRFRLRHDNGNVIADGGEGYTSRSGARTAIERIQEYVGPADYLQFDPTGFEIYRDSASEWRWRLVHRNGNVLADSGRATPDAATRAARSTASVRTSTT